jgi:hypothetical protein
MSLKNNSPAYQFVIVYDNDLDQLSIFASMTTYLLHSKLKRSHFISLSIRLSVYQTQAPLLGILIAVFY